jgi:acetyltransferase-like isoleucine patch superfamily enzyme
VIHNTAILAVDVDIDDRSEVGAYCVVGHDGSSDLPAPVLPNVHLRSHTVVYRGVSAGPGLVTGHGVLVRELTVLGDGVSIGSHSVVEHHVRIGDGARLHSGCFVPEHSVLGRGAWLGPGVIVTNARYPNRPDTKEKLEGVAIEEDAVVGAGAVLLPGVVIGAGALIGAGAIVTRDVGPGATVVGNPGRTLG